MRTSCTVNGRELGEGFALIFDPLCGPHGWVLRDPSGRDSRLVPGRDTVEIGGTPMPPFLSAAAGADAGDGGAQAPLVPAPRAAEHAPEERPLRGKVIGFRAWSIDGYRLGSANRRLHAHWRIGVNKAECLIERLHASLLQRGAWAVAPRHPPAHQAPAPDCQCGLYAYHDPWRADSFRSGAVKVYGAVTAWGRMQVHAEGFRAEFAEPVVLAYDPHAPTPVLRRQELIASELELPFVSLAELGDEAAKHGSRVPAELRPARRWEPQPREPARTSGGGELAAGLPVPGPSSGGLILVAPRRIGRTNRR